MKNDKLKITLLLDTADNKKITVGLNINGQTFFQRKKVEPRQSQVVLPMIEELLKLHRLGLKDIDSVAVNTRKGSFTGLRVGMAIANALSFTLGIPVKNKEFK